MRLFPSGNRTLGSLGTRQGDNLMYMQCPTLWHSKADKIVNNFHGQNRFQFMVKDLFFMVKTLIFVVKTDCLMFRPTNFLVRSQNILAQNFLVNLHSIPMPKFHAQPYSIPILCSTQFHSNSISWSVTINVFLAGWRPRSGRK